MIDFDKFILKHWDIEFAKDLYILAKNPLVAFNCSWLSYNNIKNNNIENNQKIIENILLNNILYNNELNINNLYSNYAIFLKDYNKKLILIGSIGIKDKIQSDLFNNDNSVELGFWIGEPFWGNGYMTEVINCMLRYLFIDLNISSVWCGYREGNIQSKRVQEKCGFNFKYLEKNKEFILNNDFQDTYINCITKDEFKKIKK